MVSSNRVKHRSLSVLLFLAVSVRIPAQPLNPKPVKELGAPRLTATQANPLALDSVNPNYVEGRELFSPASVALDNSTNPPSVYVADTSNNRVLGWRYATQLSAGAPADIVLGQKDFFTTLPQGPSGLSTGLNAPSGLVVDAAGNVYVADSGNNRIIRYPRPFAQPVGFDFPDLVLGQPSFSTNSANPTGVQATSLSFSGGSFPRLVGMVFDPAGNLWVSDPGNHRVLRFNVSVISGTPVNGAAADRVIGQTSFNANNATSTQTNKSGLNSPAGLAMDSSGRLYVVDAVSRVLVFANPAAGGPAVRLLGVAPSGPAAPVDPNAPTPVPIPPGRYIFGGASGISLVAGHPVVTDTAASRLMVFDAFENWAAETTTNLSPTAIAVVGQTSYTVSAVNGGLSGASATSLAFPDGVASSATELFVADTGNHRIIVFPIASGLPAASGSRVIGQLAPTFNTANLIEGREFSLFSSAGAGSIVIDRNASPPHLYVADTANNRILAFNDYLHVKAGDTADLVIGQQNLLTSTLNFPSNDPKRLGQNTLNQPTALALDNAGNLYVADTGNARVLRFPQPFAQSSRILQNADLVIGQSGFTAKVTDTTNRTMSAPSGVAVTADGSLLVSDQALNRVLYFAQPLAIGMVAAKVIGQGDFNSVAALPAAGTPVTNRGLLNSPRQIAVDPQDRVYICDPGNARVVIFDSVGSLPATLPQPAYVLTSNLSQPIGIAVGRAGSSVAGQVWVADFNQNLALHYPQFTQLIGSGQPDTGVAAFHPLSVAFDSFGSLAVADGANRVLQFTAQLAITNGANFVTGPLAPGTIISIFPAQSGTPALLAAAGTNASFNSLPNPVPLPTTLGGVQVTVNQQAAPLFYVSPSQINLPLPSNLPTSGTVDLEISSPSTGQVFGLTELSLAAVSPALFTLAATGNGPAAALNQDGTVNSPANPLVRGNIIVLFGTGEGVVPNAPPDGTPAAGPVPTAFVPTVVFGQGDNIITAASTDITYSGLAPGLIGVWQINVRVPNTVTAGNQVPVVISLQSVPTNPGQIQTTIALR